MIVVVHCKGYYDWVPVPPEVDTESADFKKALKQMRAKPANGGGFTMRVTVTDVGDVENGDLTMTISEAQLIEVDINEMTRGDKQPMTRSQMLTRYLTRHIMQHHFHPNWAQEVEVHDDGPSEELFREKIGLHVRAGNIEEESVEELVAQYMLPLKAQDHVDHIHTALKVKGHEAFKASRVAKKAEADAKMAAHRVEHTAIHKAAREEAGLPLQPAHEEVVS